MSRTNLAADIDRPGSPAAIENLGEPHPPLLRLDQVLTRFHLEAIHGACDTGRYQCRYYTWGQGPPLVFVPGLCDDARTFVMPIARLSTHFRCIAFDMPTGRGDGARLTCYRHENLVADLLALLDHLAVDQAYLFGASFGSTVTLAALHARPARFPRAVLQGGFACRPLAWTEELLAAFARWWPWPMDNLPLHNQLLRLSHDRPFQAREPAVWEYFLRQSGSPPMAAVAHRALMLHRLDLRAMLPKIQQPILLVVGDRDPLVGKHCEQALLDGLPRASRAELTHCGHVPQFTHPELMAEVILRYLTPLACES